MEVEVLAFFPCRENVPFARSLSPWPILPLCLCVGVLSGGFQEEMCPSLLFLFKCHISEKRRSLLGLNPTKKIVVNLTSLHVYTFSTHLRIIYLLVVLPLRRREPFRVLSTEHIFFSKATCQHQKAFVLVCV